MRARWFARCGSLRFWSRPGAADVASAACVVRNTTRAWFERDLGIARQAGGERRAPGADRQLADGRARRGSSASPDTTSRATSASWARRCAPPTDARSRRTPDFAERFGCRELGARVRTRRRSRRLPTWNDWTAGRAARRQRARQRDPRRRRGRVLGFVVARARPQLPRAARGERRATSCSPRSCSSPRRIAARDRRSARACRGVAGRDELRRVLRGGATASERRVPAAAAATCASWSSASSPREGGGGGGAWTPRAAQADAATATCTARRSSSSPTASPTSTSATRDGGIEVLHPASGLVTALEPVMRACSGVWVAHGSGSRRPRDRRRARPRARCRPARSRTRCAASGSREEEEQGYYYGFSNEGLWPLCHVAHARPVFRAEDWEHYQRGQPDVRRRGVRRGRLATTRSSSCRTTTSRSRRG